MSVRIVPPVFLLIFRSRRLCLNLLVGLDPVPEEGHPGVDTGHVAGAADAPGDQAHHRPAARLGLTDQRRAAVAGTGVLTNLSTSADLKEEYSLDNWFK